jgi:hypothetical protein
MVPAYDGTAAISNDSIVVSGQEIRWQGVLRRFEATHFTSSEKNAAFPGTAKRNSIFPWA